MFTSSAEARYLATISVGGYFGQYAAGLIFESANGYHATELSVGSYPAFGKSHYQLNLQYTYSPWLFDWDDNLWRPLNFGIFAVNSLDSDNYFKRSPAKYPSAGYYDETKIRPGTDLNSSIEFTNHKIQLTYHFRILDSGLTALVNNTDKDLQYYLSSGLSLQYYF